MGYYYGYGSSNAVITQFLKLPHMLYDSKTYVQDIETEKQLLTGTHVLSHYFSVTPIVILDEYRKPVSRCVLTFYENDPTAYVGFFESINDTKASDALFTAARRLARQNGREKLAGPLNGSFWIGYRLKTNKFGSVYTSEPYNKEYYLDLWKHAGFEVSDRYISNAFRIPTETDSSMKCRERLEMVKENGYLITTPTKETFDRNLRDIYGLLIRVYANFPMFRKVEEEEFRRLFGSLKYVLDFEFVKLIYKEQELAGFFVCIPNYQNLTHQTIRLGNLLRIWKMKNSKEKELILLYLGIDPAHPGLGAALTELVKQELVRKQVRSISALIHEGKITGKFYQELVEDQYKYVLLSRNI